MVYMKGWFSTPNSCSAGVYDILNDTKSSGESYEPTVTIAFMAFHIGANH
jgi:hypothetical protein